MEAVKSLLVKSDRGFFLYQGKLLFLGIKGVEFLEWRVWGKKCVSVCGVFHPPDGS